MFRFYLTKATLIYEGFSKKNRMIGLSLLFFVFVLMGMQSLLLSSFNRYNEINNDLDVVKQKNNELLSQQKVVVLEDARNSTKNLEKERDELTADINALLEKQNNLYLDEEHAPKLFKDFLSKTDNLKVLWLNSDLKKDLPKSQEDLLIKHYFKFQVSGKYNDLYDFLKELEKNKIFNMDDFVLEKKPDGIYATIRFYVLNRDKTLMNLGEKK
jgi:hypothetical protein